MQLNPCGTPVPQAWHHPGADPSLPGRHLDPSRSGSAIRHLRHGEIGTSYVHSAAEDLINFWCEDLAKGFLECLMSGLLPRGPFVRPQRHHSLTEHSPDISRQEAPLDSHVQISQSDLFEACPPTPTKMRKMSLNAMHSVASLPMQPPNPFPFPWCPQILSCAKPWPAIHQSSPNVKSTNSVGP